MVPFLGHPLCATIIAPAASITFYSMYLKSQQTNTTLPRSQRIAALQSQAYLRAHFAASWRNLQEYRPWTLLSSSFLHGNLPHLLFSSFGLASFSEMFIALAGARGFFRVFFGGVLMGNVTTLGLERARSPSAASGEARGRAAVERSHIGMSAGVMALTSAASAVYPRLPMGVFPIPIPIPAWLFTAAYAGFSVWSNETGFLGSIDHMGHLGGLVFGVVTGLIMRRRIGL